MSQEIAQDSLTPASVVSEIANILSADSTTVCPICLDPFDDSAPGPKAPITPSCCGNTVCRECVIKFHSAKQENTQTRLKNFPCLSCNMPKALNIEHLPAPHVSFLTMVSFMRSLRAKAALVLELMHQESTNLAKERSLQADVHSQEIKDALSSREQEEQLARQRAVDRAVESALKGRIEKETALRVEAISGALAIRAEEERQENNVPWRFRQQKKH
jgi:hypothetical protein